MADNNTTINVNGKDVEITTLGTMALFARRDNIREALDDAFNMCKGLGENEMVGMTAVMILWNTIGEDYVLVKKTDVGL
jgi:hypothetical protein